MGCSTDGQCGIDELDDVWNITRLNLPQDVTKEEIASIHAGGDTSALITKTGRLWTWGNSVHFVHQLAHDATWLTWSAQEYGQAAHGKKMDQITSPTLVDMDRVKDFHVGGSFSLLLRGKMPCRSWKRMLFSPGPSKADALFGPFLTISPAINAFLALKS